MEILHNANTPAGTHAGSEVQAIAIISVVQSFVHMWLKYESVLHKEIARQQSAEVDEQDTKRISPFTDYGVFYAVSSNLYGKKQLTMGELSNAMSVPFSRATRIIDALVADGYVKRMNDPDDRRVVRVALTPEGIKLHHTTERFTADRVQSILSVLGPEEQSLLLELMGKILPVLQKAT
ncbi:MAG: winged helix DNA-binding protein [Dehalococcoidia bacterium]|nr:winged helix DNA-binding protein [Dehalococcoidia bacterium]